MSPSNIIIATHNNHKVLEIKAVLPQSIILKSLKDLNDAEPIEETGNTLKENAIIKAKAVFQKYKQPTLADDSGLWVDALNGQPGVYSARFAGPNASDLDNCNLLLSKLHNAPFRTASFITVLCYINALGEEHIFEGKVNGQILKSPQGNNGFGYDPLFLPENESRSFAQMAAEEKNRLSHRFRALQKFSAFLNSE
jgi:XTP/dITP diphosphohydrolase